MQHRRGRKCRELPFIQVQNRQQFDRLLKVTVGNRACKAVNRGVFQAIGVWSLNSSSNIHVFHTFYSVQANSYFLQFLDSFDNVLSS